MIRFDADNSGEDYIDQYLTRTNWSILINKEMEQRISTITSGKYRKDVVNGAGYSRVC